MHVHQVNFVWPIHFACYTKIELISWSFFTKLCCVWMNFAISCAKKSATIINILKALKP